MQDGPSSDTQPNEQALAGELGETPFSQDSGVGSPQTELEAIDWTASEFVAHSKSAGWYLQLSLGAIVLAVIVWLLTRDVISASVVLVAAAALGIYGARKPRELQYSLDQNGIMIGNKHHLYDEFRSFSMATEGTFSSVTLMPLQRFAVATTIYIDPSDEVRIGKLLANYLPLEVHQHDLIDRLMARIRF